VTEEGWPDFTNQPNQTVLNRNTLIEMKITGTLARTRSALPSRTELHEQGKALRSKCSRGSLAGWSARNRRVDPVKLLEDSNDGRVPELVPIRFGRMLQSPFTFFRGAAGIMAADLAAAPSTGIRVQACGDCHLLNFGAYATPERRLVGDINDFDETLPAPWEWDVLRLATSFVIASRNNRFSSGHARDAARACVRSYREHMAEFAEMRALEVWFASIDIETVMETFGEADVRKRLKKRVAKAAKREVVEEDFPKLVSAKGGKPTIRDNPPLIYHNLTRERAPEYRSNITHALGEYRGTLEEDRRVLLDRYELRDVAAKVVGVGSVGTLCAIALLMAGEDDPLFLQVKEARRSVLEPYAGASQYSHRGRRVVVGQRLMQSASDLFLGWTSGDKGRHFYVRELRDMKLKPLVELFTPPTMQEFAMLCGWTLARAHARSGQPALISGYLGKSNQFDKAVADFAVAYADQNERDYDSLVKAARKGKIEAYVER
jgi:uncharacterized protein (DUF2252 family)